MAQICYLAAWARENGIVCHPARVEKFIQNWEETHQIGDRASWLKATNMPQTTYLAVLAEWACYDWLIRKGPLYFGFTTWLFEVALLKELQITGQAAQIVKKISHELSHTHLHSRDTSFISP